MASSEGYLTKEHLAGFDSYKYSARDTSPLSIYIMHPFWNWLVEYFPKWVAPNVMTFAGFLFTVLNFVMLSWYDWGFWASTDLPGSVPIPNWFWAAAAVNIFLAYTLDGIDGKQARRIGLSGPLGELFDHGLDSYSAFFIPGCLYSIFGRGELSVPPIRMYYIMWTIFFNFYLSHWEKYNTGVLYLPWGYDLGMWGSVLMYLATWHYGYQVWKTELPWGISAGQLMELALHVSAMSNLPMVLYNMYRSYKDRTGKMRTIKEALRPLFTYGTFMFVSLLWVFVSPNDIMNRDPRAVYILSGTVFSNISCRLIVSQMSNTIADTFNWMTGVLGLAVVLSLAMPAIERPLLYLLVVGSTLAHWEYGSTVVQQMCKHFNRICFKVTKPKPVTE
ncbi:phosphatidyltransferase [Culex quinquefasciatus]|uniref:Phosphatidyltransferase n=2 Tax=Culex pipiens complex TaxID=518105 RepID=B0WQ73_CULQU|nr:phosphatidyltransferase [Culex quinquefasciatus]|eukprot:XP_001850857.1 phosphatidyltransferase [Culex quinquefasciatus]